MFSLVQLLLLLLVLNGEHIQPRRQYPELARVEFDQLHLLLLLDNFFELPDELKCLAIECFDDST